MTSREKKLLSLALKGAHDLFTLLPRVGKRTIFSLLQTRSGIFVRYHVKYEWSRFGGGGGGERGGWVGGGAFRVEFSSQLCLKQIP